MKKVVIDLTRSELCDLMIACTHAQYSAADGGKKWKALHDKLHSELDRLDAGEDLSKYRSSFDVNSKTGKEAIAIVERGPFKVVDADTEDHLGTFFSFEELKAVWPAFELVGTNGIDTLYI